MSRVSKIFLLVLLAGCVFYSRAKGEDLKMDSPFGVLEFPHWNHSWNNYKYPDQGSLEKAAALMQEAGIAWLRMDFLWQEIEPEQGKLDFAKYDRIVELFSAHKINILGILHYNAAWASSGRQWNNPPDDNQLFVNYATRVIGRYRDKIKYWEVWNEPDSPIYWTPQDGLKSYCALLKEVYPAAKKIDPDCKILNGGLANGISSVNRLYDNGAKDYFDVLNIHIFESPLHDGAITRVAAYVRAARKIMQRKGDGHKKIWVTEIGCPGVKSGVKANNWWLGENPDEEKQAEWLGEVYGALLEEEAVEKVFWTFLRDCKNHWDNGIDYFGLVRWDYSAKPALLAYQKAVSLNPSRNNNRGN